MDLTLQPLRLLRQYGIFQPGEVAGFRPDIAEQLLNSKPPSAVRVQEPSPKPAKKPNGKTEDE